MRKSTFFVKNFSSQTFSDIERAKVFWTCRLKNSVDVENGLLPVHRKILKKLLFFRKVMIFCPFWTLNERSASCQFFWLCFQVCILRFYVTLGTLLEELLFWRQTDFGKILDIDRNFFGLESYLFWHGCQKCILRVHRNVLRRFSFLNWKYFFNHFPRWVKSFCFLPQFHRQRCQNCILRVL